MITDDAGWWDIEMPSEDQLENLYPVSERERNRQVVRDKLLPELVGGVWHVTKPARFRSILSTSSILIEPPLLDAERWHTDEGDARYPLVRLMRGISLFDLRTFDESSYSDTYPLADWKSFIPYGSNETSSVWLEISLESLGADFVSPEGVVKYQKENSIPPKHVYMPSIEGASLRDIELRDCVRRIDVNGSDFVEVDIFSA